MEAIFAPMSIAVLGASETAGSVGQKLMENLRSFRGVSYPVNPKKTSVFGIKSFPTVTAIGQKIDLAIIATPARSVPELVRECSEAGVKGAIIISAGFKECGAEGTELERQIATEMMSRLLDIGRQEKIERILGYILPDNIAMRRVCQKLGFDIRYDSWAESYKATISLDGAAR